MTVTKTTQQACPEYNFNAFVQCEVPTYYRVGKKIFYIAPDSKPLPVNSPALLEYIADPSIPVNELFYETFYTQFPTAGPGIIFQFPYMDQIYYYCTSLKEVYKKPGDKFIPLMDPQFNDVRLACHTAGNSLNPLYWKTPLKSPKSKYTTRPPINPHPPQDFLESVGIPTRVWEIRGCETTFFDPLTQMVWTRSHDLTNEWQPIPLKDTYSFELKKLLEILIQKDFTESYPFWDGETGHNLIEFGDAKDPDVLIYSQFGGYYGEAFRWYPAEKVLL